MLFTSIFKRIESDATPLELVARFEKEYEREFGFLVRGRYNVLQFSFLKPLFSLFSTCFCVAPSVWTMCACALPASRWHKRV